MSMSLGRTKKATEFLLSHEILAMSALIEMKTFLTKDYGEIVPAGLQLVNANVIIHPETQNSCNVIRAYVREHQLRAFAPKNKQ
jgi:hypothetical protein